MNWEGGKRRAKNLQLIKENNFALVFNMIYRHRSISRAQLAKITKLSPTTVSSQVDELLKKDLVVETGTGDMGTSGRKPIMITINENGCYVVSVEMTEEGYNCCLYNLLCRCLCSRHCPVTDFSLISDAITETIHDMFGQCGIPENKLIGISIGVPALIDYEKKRIITSTVVPIDGSNDFYARIKANFESVPVLMENESGFRAYAEKSFVNGESIKNLIFIDIGTGIGAGIIIDGNLYRGAFGLAGEIGHMSIDVNGPRCKCGNHGCFEVMAGIPSMIQKVLFAVMSGRETLVRDMIHGDLNRISVDLIGEAAKKGDPLALEVIDDNARSLACGINNVINLLNPQTIVIGGEIEKLGTGFLKQVKEYLSGIELRPNAAGINIRYSRLKENTSALGGARYLLDNVFSTPSLLR